MRSAVREHLFLKIVAVIVDFAGLFLNVPKCSTNRYKHLIRLNKSLQAKLVQIL